MKLTIREFLTQQGIYSQEAAQKFGLFASRIARNRGMRTKPPISEMTPSQRNENVYPLPFLDEALGLYEQRAA